MLPLYNRIGNADQKHFIFFCTNLVVLRPYLCCQLALLVFVDVCEWTYRSGNVIQMKVTASVAMWCFVWVFLSARRFFPIAGQSHAYSRVTRPTHTYATQSSTHTRRVARRMQIEFGHCTTCIQVYGYIITLYSSCYCARQSPSIVRASNSVMNCAQSSTDIDTHPRLYTSIAK